MGPLKVRCALDATGVIVSVGGTYADATNPSFCLGRRNDAVQGLCQFGHKRFYRFIGIRTDNRLFHNGTTGIHNAAFGGLSTYINTNY